MTRQTVSTFFKALCMGFLGAMLLSRAGAPRMGFFIGLAGGLVLFSNLPGRSLIRMGLILTGLIGLFVLFPLVFLFIPAIWVGALGLIAYLMWKSLSPGRSRDVFMGSSARTEMLKSYLGIIAAVIQKSDGNKRMQIRTVRRLMNFTGGQDELWNQFLKWLDEEINIEPMIDEINKSANPGQRRYFLQILVSLALLGEDGGENTKQLIHEIASGFNISSEHVEKLFRMAQNSERGRRRSQRWSTNGGRSRRRRSRQDSIKDAYETLGVDSSASKEEVKEAYQEKVKKYHPDRFRNGDDTEYEQAEEKMAEVNKAYQRIKDTWEST